MTFTLSDLLLLHAETGVSLEATLRPEESSLEANILEVSFEVEKHFTSSIQLSCSLLTTLWSDVRVSVVSQSGTGTR